MPVAARQFIRKLRGGAQAHLVEAEDGHFYVVKFRNNPQHRRILVNEWLTAAVFDHLKIQIPPIALIDVPEAFLAANPEVFLQLGAKRVPVEPGWHFGSRFPGNPSRLAVYDYLPDQLLTNVYNLADFRAAFVADKWLGNSDGRQAVFFRAQIRDWTADPGVHPLRKAFLAQMIDHGFSFNGPHWDFPDSPLQGIYFRHLVYDAVQSIDSFEPWLTQVRHFPIDVLDRAWRGIPPEWIGDDAEAMEKLIATLIRRQARVADLIADTRNGRVNPFTNWRSSAASK